MLRVYSILYIERLWNPNPSYTPISRQEVQSSNTSIYTSTPYVEIENDATRGEVVLEEEEVIDLQEEEVIDLREEEFIGLQEEEVIDLQEEEVIDLQGEEVVVVEIEQEEEEKEEPAVTAVVDNDYTLEVVEIESIATEEDGKVSMVASSEEQEVFYRSLESSIKEEEEEEEIDNIASSPLSSTSSIVPPSTPPSIHTNNITYNIKDKPSSSPRTPSLLRRETFKFNDRRKSLTKKLKRVLNTTTNNNNTKRNSV